MGPKTTTQAASQSQSQPSKFGGPGFLRAEGVVFFSSFFWGWGEGEMTHAQWGHYIVNIFWVVVSIFFSPLFGEDSHFDDVIFFKRIETTNQFCC